MGNYELSYKLLLQALMIEIVGGLKKIKCVNYFNLSYFPSVHVLNIQL